MLKRVQRPSVLMLVWGLAFGLVTAFVLHALVPHEWSIMESRAMGMRASLAVLNEGGPLLVGRHDGMGSYYPVALGDDPGAFTYFPVLAHLLGGVSPLVVLSYFYVLAVAALAAIYPLIFYRLTGALLAGFAAPIMLVVCILSIGYIDIYWIPAWGMLALLPALYLLARSWPRFGLAALIAIALGAGWLSSIRNDAGLGILVTGATVLLLRRWRWWRAMPALALLVAAYMSTSSFVWSAVREHRDHALGVRMLTDDEMTHHPLFHTAYDGLGYLHNGYGIRFKDEIAAAHVQDEAPGTVYMSHKYETVIRKVFFNFVRAHPLEAFKQYGAKAVVAVADTGPYLLLVLLTLPAMLLLGRDRRVRRLWVLLTLPAMLVGFIQPMVAIPGQRYDAELFGVLGVLGIVGICWVLGQAESRARERGGPLFVLAELRAECSTRAGRSGPLGRSMRVSAVTTTVLVLICTGGYLIRQSSFRWQGIHPSAWLRYVG